MFSTSSQVWLGFFFNKAYYVQAIQIKAQNAVCGPKKNI